MKYQIYIKHTDGTGSYLQYRGRTEWTLRAARKHKLDIALKIVRGEWLHAESCMLVPA
jgi:hypothetical protein